MAKATAKSWVRWSKEEDDLLRTGVSPAEAAKILGRSCGSVGIRRRALGLPRRTLSPKPWTAEQIALFENHSDEEIARLTGRRRASVQVKRQALGIPAYRRCSVCGGVVPSDRMGIGHKQTCSVQCESRHVRLHARKTWFRYRRRKSDRSFCCKQCGALVCPIKQRGCRGYCSPECAEESLRVRARLEMRGKYRRERDAEFAHSRLVAGLALKGQLVQ